MGNRFAGKDRSIIDQVLAASTFVAQRFASGKVHGFDSQDFSIGGKFLCSVPVLSGLLQPGTLSCHQVLIFGNGHLWMGTSYEKNLLVIESGKFFLKLPNREGRKAKWFDRLTMLSHVEGQIQYSYVQMLTTGKSKAQSPIPLPVN